MTVDGFGEDRDARSGGDPDDRTSPEPRVVVDAATIRFIRAARRAAGQPSAVTDPSAPASQTLHPG